MSDAFLGLLDKISMHFALLERQALFTHLCSSQEMQTGDAKQLKFQIIDLNNNDKSMKNHRKIANFDSLSEKEM